MFALGAVVRRPLGQGRRFRGGGGLEEGTDVGEGGREGAAVIAAAARHVAS